MVSEATVYIADDDDGIRDALAWVLGGMGLCVESYGSGEELLRGSNPDLPGCFLLDLQMPRMNGFALQKELVLKGCLQPFIMVSGHADISLAIQAMHLGALDFIEKPFNHQRVLDCVNRALKRDAAQRQARAARAAIQARLDLLTARERQVMERVVVGDPSKRIASRLGICMKTVEVHRSNIMKKMAVESVAELTSLATRAALDAV